jgi:Coenzyme PQQ synthesis protein D (PqqD)
MKTAPGRPDVVAIRDDIVYREIDGEIVALSITSGEYLTLDATGSQLWRLIEQLGSIDRIKSALLAEYDLDDRSCDAEVQAFVTMLEAKGLVSCGSR